MKVRFGTVALMALSWLLVSAGQLFAVDGDIVYTYGQVLVHRNPDVVTAEIGMPVGEGDVIETAVMGVRGTEFFVAYGRKIDSYRDVWVCVNAGSVEVAVLETRDTLIVEEGKGINIVGGTNLTSPQRYPWTRKLNWNMDPADGSVEDRTDLEQAYSDLLDQDYD